MSGGNLDVVEPLGRFQELTLAHEGHGKIQMAIGYFMLKDALGTKFRSQRRGLLKRLNGRGTLSFERDEFFVPLYKAECVEVLNVRTRCALVDYLGLSNLVL